MIILATSSVVIYTLTISVLFLTVLILALFTVVKMEWHLQLFSLNLTQSRFISVWVTEFHLLPWHVQKLWQCTGLSTEFPNDEWTKHFISSAKGPLSGSGVWEDCRDEEAWSVTSCILSVGLSSESLQYVTLFSAIIFLTKWRTTQWVYDKTIAKSKFIQNTCSGSWFLCKEWKQFNLSEAMLGHHLCSTNHVVVVWERG